MNTETGKPLCYGLEDAEQFVCMMCPVALVCREEKVDVVPSSLFPEPDESLPILEYDDDEDEMLDEEED